MPKTSSDEQTVAFYDREAAVYTKSTAPDRLPDHLIRFAQRLPKGGSVLDLGCGGGWAAKGFLDLGFASTAMDASAGMIREVRKIPGLSVVHGDFDALADISAYDGIWASFSLQHSPRKNTPRVLNAISTALRADGWLYIGIHEGPESMRDNLGRLYCHYTEGELANLLLDQMLEVRSIERDKSTGYDGRAIDCMHVEARKIG